MAKADEFIPQTDPTLAQILARQTDLTEQLATVYQREGDKTREALEGFVKQWKPQENRRSPEVSVYNPLGERDHPRPQLKCQMMNGPYPIERDTLTWEEIDLLNQLEPGVFSVQRTDGSYMRLTITGERDANDTLTKLTIRYPMANEEDNKHVPRLVPMLQQILGMAAPSREALEAELARLQALVGAQSMA